MNRKQTTPKPTARHLDSPKYSKPQANKSQTFTPSKSAKLIALSASSSRSKDLPWQRSLSWYLMIVTTNSLYGSVFYKTILQLNIPTISTFIYFCLKHHKFVTASLYIIGFVWFVTSLRVGYYKFQLAQLSWTLMLLFFVIYQSHFMVHSILEGMFWFILPSFLVIVNDIFAYIFGFFFGKHQLILLSPKKTWEGFLGGAFSTIVFAFLSTPYISRYSYFICPPQNVFNNAFNFPSCDPNSVFIETEYIIPASFSFIAKALGHNSDKVAFLPIQFHSIGLAMFASIIAPFGGFFASGVKRALKIKDFGDSIPGHGGATDRFDCQFIMATFSYFYYSTFVRSTGILGAKVLSSIIYNLSLDDQVQLYQSLGEHLSLMNITRHLKN
ncbi:hypothetical protein BB561_002069 [Smittium simulii]|uniref:Phosphatidate cytidylyltransferase n=1 Tax=Smittium simulii TaxID=133385 RepID=A0A2T9YRV9_9FUNG|nr:hypothetical protein BB561_002069 [Smittium simulii]